MKVPKLNRKEFIQFIKGCDDEVFDYFSEGLQEIFQKFIDKDKKSDNSFNPSKHENMK